MSLNDGGESLLWARGQPGGFISPCFYSPGPQLALSMCSSPHLTRNGSHDPKIHIWEQLSNENLLVALFEGENHSQWLQQVSISLFYHHG